ncbi:hypothetical protein CL621_01135 [archaeon]|nr:hypothetical protein [archaeon]
MAKKKNKKKDPAPPSGGTNPEEQKQLSPAEALDRLTNAFKTGTADEKDNILFNLIMRMGQTVDLIGARVDMVGTVINQLPEVQEITKKMRDEHEKQMAENAKAGAEGKTPDDLVDNKAVFKEQPNKTTADSSSTATV